MTAVGTTFEFKGRMYSIHRDIKMGEYRKFLSTNARLNELTTEYDGKEFDNIDDVTELSASIRQKLNASTKLSDDQMNLLVNFVADVLQLKQEEIDDMDLFDCQMLFFMTFKACTEIKKKLPQPSV